MLKRSRKIESKVQGPMGDWKKLGGAAPVVCRCCNHYCHGTHKGLCLQCTQNGCSV